MDSSSKRSIGCISQSILSMLLLLVLFAASQIGLVAAIQNDVPGYHLVNPLNNETRRVGAMEVEAGASRLSELLHIFPVGSYDLEDQQLAILGDNLRYDPISHANRPAKSNPIAGQSYTGRPNSNIYHNPG